MWTEEVMKIVDGRRGGVGYCGMERLWDEEEGRVKIVNFEKGWRLRTGEWEVMEMGGGWERILWIEEGGGGKWRLFSWRGGRG